MISSISAKKCRVEVYRNPNKSKQLIVRIITPAYIKNLFSFHFRYAINIPVLPAFPTVWGAFFRLGEGLVRLVAIRRVAQLRQLLNSYVVRGVSQLLNNLVIIQGVRQLLNSLVIFQGCEAAPAQFSDNPGVSIAVPKQVSDNPGVCGSS